MGDLIHGVLTLAARAPRYATRLALELAWRSAGTVERLTPRAEARVAWKELENKLEAFALFECVELPPDPLGPGALAAEVRRATVHGPFRSVWVVEGIGHCQAEAAWARTDSPEALLSGPETRDLPETSLVPLHSGMGLSLANRCLADVRADRDEDIAAALARFRSLCQGNARPGYFGAAYEAVGLVVRNVYPALLDPADGALLGQPELRDYFWHGVGRALYLGPGSLLPESAHRARARPFPAAEDPAAGRNVAAGLAWAVTLVNLRCPDVLAAALEPLSRPDLAGDAIVDGIASALAVWRAAAPDDPGLPAPGEGGAGGGTAASARGWLADAAAGAARRHAEVRASGEYGGLFRCRTEARP
jgi:hypothetical protein